MYDVKSPLILADRLWPDVRFYPEQCEIVESVRDSKETVVVAGNMLGKDYVAGFIATSFFLAPQLYFDPEYVASIESTRSINNPHPHTVRVITSSVAEHHLKVLWGEIGRFVGGCQYPLVQSKENPNGPLSMNYQEIRYARERWSKNPLNYLVGRVSAKGEGMAGHHAAYTLGIIDEASGVDNLVYTQIGTWAKRILMIGNPNPCPVTHFFRDAVKKGTLLKKE